MKRKFQSYLPYIGYKPKQGTFYWLPNPFGKTGVVTASVKKNTCAVWLDGQCMSVGQLAWLLYYGKPCKSLLYHEDGNIFNYRIRNLKPLDKHKITYEELSKLINYNPLTDEVSWKIRFGKRLAGDLITASKSSKYINVNLFGYLYRLHNVIWFFMTGEWPEDIVDHKNRKPRDNRWDNLRSATHSQNAMNRKKRNDYNKSKYKGVHWSSDGRWKAVIQIEGTQTVLGYFESQKKAARRYDKAAKKHHKEFACTNVDLGLLEEAA